MFHNCTIHVMPLGSFSRVRRTIIEKNIESNGGKVVQKLDDATHILIPEHTSIDRPEFRGHLSKLIKEEWYTLSVQLKKKIDEKPYRIVSCESPKRIEKEDIRESSPKRIKIDVAQEQKQVAREVIALNSSSEEEDELKPTQLYVGTSAATSSTVNNSAKNPSPKPHGLTNSPLDVAQEQKQVACEVIALNSSSEEEEEKKEVVRIVPSSSSEDELKPTQLFAGTSAATSSISMNNDHSAKNPSQKTNGVINNPLQGRVLNGQSKRPIDAILNRYQEKLISDPSNFACQILPPRIRRNMSDSSTQSPGFTQNIGSPTLPTQMEETFNDPLEIKLNEGIITIFSNLAEIVDTKTGTDAFRARANRKVAAIISALTEELTLENYEKLCKDNKIGGKSLIKIKEYLESGNIQQKALLESCPKRQAVALLTKIWGAGPTTAEKWFAKGYRTIEDIRQAQKDGKLHENSNQKVGIQFYEEFQIKIPRNEVKQIFQKVKEASEGFPIEKFECVGSYRRKKAHCGDIDILI